MTKRELFFILVFVSGWRAALFLVAYCAQFFFTSFREFTYPGTYLGQDTNWWYSWGNFDGVHYHRILTDGYLNSASIQAFFPGYPVLARVFSPLSSNPFLLLMLTSHVFLFVFAVIWYWFVKQVYSAQIAQKSLLVLMLFPTSFYLGATYSESLFMSTTLLAFAAAWKRQFHIAAVGAFTASATRIVGIFTVPALMIESVLTHVQGKTRIHATPVEVTPHQQLVSLLKISAQDLIGYIRAKWRTFLVLMLSAGGLLGYMAFLWIYFDDPLLFLHVQSSFGAGRSDDFILLPQVIWRQLKILATVAVDWRWFVYLQDLIVTLTALGLLLFGYCRSRKLLLSWIMFGLGALLLPPLTGILSSMPRYVLVIFPMYLLIAEWLDTKPRYIQIVYFAVSTVVLILNTMLFIQGHWVA